MDLDYSKLSTKELEAIANNDYSKLSTKTLEALANPPEDKSAWQKFAEPLANMSWEDWRKNSIASPTMDLLQSLLPGGTEEQFQAANQRVREKGNQIVGGLANIIQHPIDTASQAINAVSENPAGVAGELVKGAIYDPNLALLPGTGDAAMAAGRGVMRGAEAVGQGAKAIATAPIQTYKNVAPKVVQGVKDVGAGFKEGLTNPTYVRNENTAFAPLQKEGYYPQEQVKPFMEAAPENRPQMVGQVEQSLTPPGELFNTTGELLAKNWGPVAPTGENLIPYQGQTWKAFGEQLGRDVANNPFKNIGLPSLGGAVAGGLAFGPMGAMAGAGLGATANPMLRAAELATLNKLGKTAGFVKGFPEEFQAAKQLAGQRGVEAMRQATPSQNILPNPAGNLGLKANMPPTALTYEPKSQAPVSAPVEPTPINQQPPAAPEAPAPQAPAEPKPAVPEGQTTSVNPEVSSAKQGLLTQNPELYRFNQPYVIPSKNEGAIESFLSGNDKRVVAHGAPGTGKSSLAGEWLKRNPNGKVEFISSETSLKELKQMEKDLATSEKTLFLVDEADKLSPGSSKFVTENLSHSPNAQTMFTTNELGKVHKNITNTSQPIDFNYKLSPDEKLVYGLNMAEKYNVKKSVDEIKQIVNKAQNFRDIKRGVTEGVMTKSEPVFQMNDVSQLDLPDNIKTTFDNLINNRSEKNVVIIDSSVYKADPNFAEKLNKLTHTNPIDKHVIDNLVTSKTSSPLYRLEIQDKADANKISALKGYIEKSNESGTPTNLIIEDRHGNLDPAIKSRATIITSKDLGLPESTPTVKKGPGNVSQMLIGGETGKDALSQSIVGKRSFNEDLQKYRYGTKDNPLTVEEYKHLTDSDLISHQNTKDRLMGMKPELTEYSIWYKDKTGKIHNRQTHGGELK